MRRNWVFLLTTVVLVIGTFVGALCFMLAALMALPRGD